MLHSDRSHTAQIGLLMPSVERPIVDRKRIRKDHSTRISRIQARSRRLRTSLDILEKDTEILATEIAKQAILDLISRNVDLVTSPEFSGVLKGLYREGRGVSVNAMLREFRALGGDLK